MDLKTIYLQNFRVLCVTLHQPQKELDKKIKELAEDGIIKFPEFSIHLLKKTRTPSGILYHIRVIDNKTDRCVLQGPLLLPQKKTKVAKKQPSKKAPTTSKSSDSDLAESIRKGIEGARKDGKLVTSKANKKDDSWYTRSQVPQENVKKLPNSTPSVDALGVLEFLKKKGCEATYEGKECLADGAYIDVITTAPLSEGQLFSLQRRYPRVCTIEAAPRSSAYGKKELCPYRLELGCSQ